MDEPEVVLRVRNDELRLLRAVAEAATSVIAGYFGSKSGDGYEDMKRLADALAAWREANK